MAPFRFPLKVPLAGLVMAAVLALSSPAMAAETRTQGLGPNPPTPTGILINLPARTLYYYVDGSLVRVFPVGIGRTPVGDRTPTGAYRIQNKAVNPWWLPPWGGDIVPPGPTNPLGTRWMAFNGSYGIHGNIDPNSIGGTVSAGCIRMFNADVEWLYDQVGVGLPVNVTYNTAQIEQDGDGRKYLAIYPDVYGYGSTSVAKTLTAAGFDADTVTPGGGKTLYRLDAQALANGQSVPAVLHKGRPYLAARALATRMGAAVAWDGASNTVALDGQSVVTVLRGSTGYVDAEEAAAVLGVGYSWNTQTNTAALSGTPVFLNGHLLNRSGTALEGEAYVPVRAVGEAAGATIGWDNDARQATVNGVPVRSVLRGSRAYAEAGLLARTLNLKYSASQSAVYFEN
ncbi:MAG TPA: L,D-transpeptidase family protein [Symbiobacteriaceae bacterium]|nr:L,D-transpeptidase family protein [Symbiobacteriaceae bacterium]